MIDVNEFGVRPVGNAGSRHAAHAALAASHMRRAAAATDASVDRGSTR